MSWRFHAHQSDPLRVVRPDYFILSDQKVQTLAHARPETVLSVTAIISTLDETAEWGARWGQAILDVITAFDREQGTIITLPTAKKQKTTVSTRSAGLVLQNVTNIARS